MKSQQTAPKLSIALRHFLSWPTVASAEPLLAKLVSTVHFNIWPCLLNLKLTNCVHMFSAQAFALSVKLCVDVPRSE